MALVDSEGNINIRQNLSLRGGVAVGKFEFVRRGQLLGKMSDLRDQDGLAEDRRRMTLGVTTDWYGPSVSTRDGNVSTSAASDRELDLKEALDQQFVYENLFDDEVAIMRRGLPPCKRTSLW